MMTQSVMTQTASLSLTPAGTSAPRSKRSSGGFELFMDRSIRSTDSTDAQIKAKAAQTKGKPTDTEALKGKQAFGDEVKSKPDDAAADSNRDKAVDKEETSQKVPVGAEQRKTVAETAQTSQSAEEVPEEKAGGEQGDQGWIQLQEQLLSLLQTLQQTVMEQLQLTPEEFEDLLREQGLVTADLTEPESLQQLLMAKNGSSDVLDFLTDGNLKGEFDQLLQQVEAILKEADFKLSVDQLKTALQELATRTEQEAGQTAEIVTETEIKKPEMRSEQQKPVKDEPSVKEKESKPEEHDKGPKTELVHEADKERENRETTSDQRRDEAFEQEKLNSYETFLKNLTKPGLELEPEPIPEARAMELQQIADQILERIRVVVKPEQTSMEMVLNPEHLGKVNLTVVSKDGTMTASFKVHNELAREAIESQLQVLKETLNAQGIKVEAIEVTVSSYSFGESQSSGEEDQATDRNKNQGHKLTLEEALQLNEQSEEEEGLADITGLRGTNIDMTA